MPKKKFIDDFRLFEKEIQHSSTDHLVYLPKVIQKQADRYKIAIYSIKKRLLDLGYEFVGGIFNYGDLVERNNRDCKN